jgi:Tol biopolymer transport system component
MRLRRPVTAVGGGRLVTLFFLVAAGLSGPGVARAAQGDTVLASRASGVAGAKANLNSVGITLSGNGRYALFQTQSTNLSPDDDEIGFDVYVRDLQTSTTTLVSRASGFLGAKASYESRPLGISADGRYAAFYTSSSLVPADANVHDDVYVRDLRANTTTLVSRAGGVNGAVGNVGSGGEVAPGSGLVSADGRYVAFSSRASNLDPADTDFDSDVFVRDLQENTTTLVSRASGGVGTKGNGDSDAASISADGRHVLFNTKADNLDAADIDSDFDGYVRDTAAGTTTLVTRATGVGGPSASVRSFGTALSGDGRYAVFNSTARELGSPQPDPFSDVYLRDTQTGTTSLVSRHAVGSGPESDGDAMGGAITPDGHYVAFRSQARIDPVVPAGGLHIYVRDTQTDDVITADRATGAIGAVGSWPAQNESLSADGRYVMFTSYADNLSPDDNDIERDVYRRDLRGGPDPESDPAPGPGDDPGSSGALPVSGTTPGVAPPPVPAVCGPIKQAAKLGLARATFHRARRTISILAPISRNASGTAHIELLSAGMSTTFRAAVDAVHGRIRVTHPIGAAQARAGTGVVTIRYDGDSDTRAQTLRLRAAARHADFGAARPTLTADGVLRASGTATIGARGDIRLTLEFNDGPSDKVVTVRRSAPIRRGHWQLTSQLPETVLVGLRHRCGTVDASMQYTGSRAGAVRGEQRFFRVLPDRG